jgi:hypothetical protein
MARRNTYSKLVTYTLGKATGSQSSSILNAIVSEFRDDYMIAKIRKYLRSLEIWREYFICKHQGCTTGDASPMLVAPYDCQCIGGRRFLCDWSRYDSLGFGKVLPAVNICIAHTSVFSPAVPNCFSGSNNFLFPSIQHCGA